jgi:hypothetical protein
MSVSSRSSICSAHRSFEHFKSLQLASKHLFFTELLPLRSLISPNELIKGPLLPVFPPLSCYIWRLHKGNCVLHVHSQTAHNPTYSPITTITEISQFLAMRHTQFPSALHHFCQLTPKHAFTKDRSVKGLRQCGQLALLSLIHRLMHSAQ